MILAAETLSLTLEATDKLFWTVIGISGTICVTIGVTLVVKISGNIFKKGDTYKKSTVYHISGTPSEVAPYEQAGALWEVEPSGDEEAWDIKKKEAE